MVAMSMEYSIFFRSSHMEYSVSFLVVVADQKLRSMSKVVMPFLSFYLNWYAKKMSYQQVLLDVFKKTCMFNLHFNSL